jgi:hypothetical protein
MKSAQNYFIAVFGLKTIFNGTFPPIVQRTGLKPGFFVPICLIMEWFNFEGVNE